MNHFVFAFETVFPLCFLILLGFGVRNILHLEKKTIAQMNKVCFYCFLSSSLFFNVYKADFTSIPYRLVLTAMVVVILFFGITWFLFHHTGLCSQQKALMIQGICRSNYILFGLPLSASFFGAENIDVTAILIAFIIPLFNLLSIVLLQGYQEKTLKGKAVVQATFKNPLIVASICAFVCVGFKLTLPAFVVASIQPLANAATPLALFLLGASLVFEKGAFNVTLISIAVIGKLFVFPMIMLAIILLLGVQKEAFVALFALSASPTAVSSYTMAQSMKMKDELAGQIVVFTTLFSMLSLFLWIGVIKVMI